jgi:hypothetical protein
VTNASAKRSWAITGINSTATAVVAVGAAFDTGHPVFAMLAALNGVFVGVCLAAWLTIHYDYEGR